MARKKKPEAPPNLGRWMVSYADFMTLLFATFLVLYAFAMAKQSEAQSMAQSVAQAFNESLVTASGGVLLIPGSLEEKLTKATEEVQKEVEDKQEEVRTVDEGGGTIMNFTAAGSPEQDTPNTSGGSSGTESGRSGQSEADVSRASGTLIVSESKTPTAGKPYSDKPAGGSDSGAGGFTPGSPMRSPRAAARAPTLRSSAAKALRARRLTPCASPSLRLWPTAGLPRKLRSSRTSTG